MTSDICRMIILVYKLPLQSVTLYTACPLDAINASFSASSCGYAGRPHLIPLNFLWLLYHIQQYSTAVGYLIEQLRGRLHFVISSTNHIYVKQPTELFSDGSCTATSKLVYCYCQINSRSTALRLDTRGCWCKLTSNKAVRCRFLLIVLDYYRHYLSKSPLGHIANRFRAQACASFASFIQHSHTLHHCHFNFSDCFSIAF